MKEKEKRPIKRTAPAKISIREVFLSLAFWSIISISGSFANALRRPSDSFVTVIDFDLSRGPYLLN